MWTITGNMVVARTGHTATLLPDGRVLVAGGYDEAARIPDTEPTPLSSAELYDPSTGRWVATASMGTARAFHEATLLPDGRVLVLGGGGEQAPLFEGGPRSNTAETYDPRTGTWAATNNMLEPRTGFSATLLPNGTMLVVGGDPGYMASEIYDPASEQWTATGSMADGRFGHTATLLPDGAVLVTGGCACSEPDPWDSAELYDPSSGRWTATGSMAEGRMGHTATLLGDGTVLVVADEPFVDGPGFAEVYDPATGQWTVTPNMVEARIGPTATLLADGTLLVAGGYDRQRAFDGGTPVPLASAERYDPITKQWTTTASMATPHFGARATLLTDGRVLLAGGAGNPVTGDLPAPELYDPGTR